MENEIYAKEIQIRDLKNDNSYTLVLICDNEKIANSLNGMIDNSQGKYHINCYTNDKNNFSLGLALSTSEFIAELRINTTKNRVNYLPIDWLMANKVKFISTGWLDVKGELTYILPKPLSDIVFLPSKE